MAKIFISYRREDSQHQADRLHAALARKIPKRNIFIDVDNIPVGVDFVQHLNQQVGQCDVLLALIGPDWLDVKNPQTGQRRLDDPKDFVRIEIAAALRRGIPVAPVLLDGAPFPPEHRLPEDLKALTLRHGVEVRRLTFDADAERLVRGLDLGRSAASAKPAPSRPASAPRSTGATSAWIGPVVALALLAIGGGAFAWFGNPGDWRGAGAATVAENDPFRSWKDQNCRAVEPALTVIKGAIRDDSRWVHDIASQTPPMASFYLRAQALNGGGLRAIDIVKNGEALPASVEPPVVRLSRSRVFARAATDVQAIISGLPGTSVYLEQYACVL